VEGNALVISVVPDDVQFYISFNNFQFAGAVIHISQTPQQNNVHPTFRGQDDQMADTPRFSFGASQNKIMKEKLFAILSRRYDPNLKILNLSNLGSEPEVQELGVDKLSDPKFFRIFTVLCEEAFKTAQERKEGVTGIQLSGNNFKSLSTVRTFTITFPDLANLDLSNNNITTLGDLAPVRKFAGLEHLIIANNPIITKELSLKEELIKWFPKLRHIDQLEITEADKAQARKPKPIPLQVSTGLFVDVDGIGETFLKEFFPGFDSDRAGLAKFYYDKDSIFSLAVNNHALVDQSSKQTLRRNEWADWIRQSRNLVKINHLTAQSSRTHRGVGAIIKIFGSLPMTSHPSLEDLSKWLVEAMPVEGLPDPTHQSAVGVNGLMITVHGEFLEHPKDPSRRKSRSFDRTFVLGPGGANGVRVISDMLLLRSYGGTKAFSNAQVAPEVERAQMVVELARQTGMNEQYSTMALEQTGWRLEAALESFQAVKANIPPEAFVQQ